MAGRDRPHLCIVTNLSARRRPAPTVVSASPTPLGARRSGGLIHVPRGTPLQTVNDGVVDLALYAYGAPRDTGAEVLSDAA
jgi:hypothetical protein